MLERIFYSFRTYIHEYPILFPYMWFDFFVGLRQSNTMENTMYKCIFPTQAYMYRVFSMYCPHFSHCPRAPKANNQPFLVFQWIQWPSWPGHPYLDGASLEHPSCSMEETSRCQTLLSAWGRSMDWFKGKS